MKYCDRCHRTYPSEFTTCPKDQGALRPVSELLTGMVLRGKYQILDKIGAGGMATVYRVRHLYLREDVAIKVVSNSLAEDQQFVDRFKTEAVITRRLRHPNAVRLDDFDTTEDGRPFIVMEYVRGQSLREILRQQGCLSAARAANIARQVALALGAAHELGIVHRDIKPENILLVPQQDGSDLVKVLDFGIAKVRNNSLDVGTGYTPTQTGMVLGTPQYLAPEQARGKHNGGEVDGRADLYALGIVLYEMLTGRLPFYADSPFDLLLHQIETPPTPPHLASPAVNLSPAMSELVMKALEKDPIRRFQTGKELAEALSNPEALVQAPPSAHAFSTEALAAAAAGVAGAEAKNDVVAPIPGSTAPAVLSAKTALKTAVANTLPTTSEDPGRGDTIPYCAPALPAMAASQLRKRYRIGKWALVACGVVAMILMVRALIPHQPAEPVPANVPEVAAPVPEKRSAVTPRRSSISRRTSAPERLPRTADAVQQVRVQGLVATGYRHMQERDFEGARDAFEQALELDPDNAAAQKGLRAAETAQTVQGVAGVFRR